MGIGTGISCICRAHTLAGVSVYSLGISAGFNCFIWTLTAAYIKIENLGSSAELGNRSRTHTPANRKIELLRKGAFDDFRTRSGRRGWYGDGGRSVYQSAPTG